MRRQRVRPIATAVDDEHVETGACEQHRGGSTGDSGADVPQKPLTVTFNAEQTVEFLGGMSDPDVTMLTNSSRL